TREALCMAEDARDLQSLCGRRRTPEPAIIREIDQQVCATQDKSPDLVRKHGLVTDKSAEIAAGQITHSVVGAAAKVACKPRKILGEPEKVAPRHVFAEGNQMNFIIVK